MRFGEYLVKRGWITEEQLLGALIEQDRMPEHEAKVLLDAGAVAASDLLRAFDHATDTGVGFVRALREQGSWTERIEEALAKCRSERRMPIGLVLARRKVLPLLKVVEALEEFEAERAAVRGIVLERAQSEVEEARGPESAGIGTEGETGDAPLARFLPPDFLPEFWKRDLALWSRLHASARAELGRELDRWFDRLSRLFVDAASRQDLVGRQGLAPFLSIVEESLRLVGTVRESLATIESSLMDRIAALLLLSMEQAAALEDADADSIGRAVELVKRLKMQRLSLSLGRQGLGGKLPASIRQN